MDNSSAQPQQLLTPSFFRLKQPTLLEGLLSGGASSSSSSSGGGGLEEPSTANQGDEDDTLGTFASFHQDAGSLSEGLPSFFQSSGPTTSLNDINLDEYMSIPGVKRPDQSTAAAPASSDIFRLLGERIPDRGPPAVQDWVSSIPLPPGAQAMSSAVPPPAPSSRSSSGVPLPSGATILSSAPAPGLSFANQQQQPAPSQPSQPLGTKIDWKSALSKKAGDAPSSSSSSSGGEAASSSSSSSSSDAEGKPAGEAAPNAGANPNGGPVRQPLHPMAFGMPMPFMTPMGPMVMGPHGPVPMGPNGPMGPPMPFPGGFPGPFPPGGMMGGPPMGGPPMFGPPGGPQGGPPGPPPGAPGGPIPMVMTPRGPMSAMGMQMVMGPGPGGMPVPMAVGPQGPIPVFFQYPPQMGGPSSAPAEGNDKQEQSGQRKDKDNKKTGSNNTPSKKGPAVAVASEAEFPALGTEPPKEPPKPKAPKPVVDQAAATTDPADPDNPTPATAPAPKPRGKTVWQLVARPVDDEKGDAESKASKENAAANTDATAAATTDGTTPTAEGAPSGGPGGRGGRGRGGRGRGAEGRGGRGSSTRSTTAATKGQADQTRPNLKHPRLNPKLRVGRGAFAASAAGRGAGRGGRGRGEESDLIQVGPRGAYGLGTHSGAFSATGNRAALKGGSTMMSGADIRHVCERVLQPLRFPDPYSDDYYYIQTSVRRNAVSREAAIKESQPLPSPIKIPQPIWRDIKERIRGQLDEFKQKIYDRSRDWEVKEQVLGHLVRSQADRPKALLSVPSMRELRAEALQQQQQQDADALKPLGLSIEDAPLGSLGGMDSLDSGAAGSGSAAGSSSSSSSSSSSMAGGASALAEPFSSRLWSMRQAVLRGYEALATVQELTQLLRSSTAAQDPFARSEILYDMDRALNLLSQSVGIRLSHSTSLTAPNASANPSMLGLGLGDEVQLEGGLVAVLLQSAKGRKLLSRSMTILQPEYRWALIPVILARILQTDPSEQNEEDKEVEEKLMRAILQFAQHSHQYQQEMQSHMPQGITHPFSLQLLKNLRQTVRSCMVAHLEKSQLRQALLSSRHRAEVMHVIVQQGQEVKACVDEAARNEWMHICEAFYTMLDN